MIALTGGLAGLSSPKNSIANVIDRIKGFFSADNYGFAGAVAA